MMATGKKDKGRGISSQIKTVFRSLQHRNYRLFFGGQSISLIGTWMQRIALPWLVYQMTGSEVLLGIVGFAAQIPSFLLAPVAGVLIDRWSRYRVLVVTQVISMIQAGILAWLSLSGSLEIWHIIALSLIMGCINAFDMPARHSFVIDMVENKDDMGNAIALNSMMFNGARLIGPSIAGIVLATTGEGICFLINAVSYIFIIISLLAMHVPVYNEKKKKTRIFSELKEGLAYAFGFPADQIDHSLAWTGKSHGCIISGSDAGICKGYPARRFTYLRFPDGCCRSRSASWGSVFGIKKERYEAGKIDSGFDRASVCRAGCHGI